MLPSYSVMSPEDVRLDVGNHSVHPSEILQALTVPTEDHFLVIEGVRRQSPICLPTVRPDL